MASLAVVHQNEINVYLVLGGVELVSSTGLTVSISKIKYLEKLTLTKPSPRDPEELTVVPAKMGNEPIFIILEPVLKNGQTMFIINRYANSQTDKTYRRKSQTLQVSHPLRSGAAWPSTCRKSTGLTTCSSATVGSSAQCASPTPPT